MLLFHCLIALVVRPVTYARIKSRRRSGSPGPCLVELGRNYAAGRSRQSVRSGRPGGYLNVAARRAGWAGAAYCFPIDPRDDQHVQAHKKYEVEGARRPMRPSWWPTRPGMVTVLAALAKEAVPVGWTSSRTARWDYQALSEHAAASDPEAELMGIVQRNAAQPRHISSYDVATYVRGVPRYARVSLPLLGLRPRAGLWASGFGPPYAFRWGYGLSLGRVALGEGPPAPEGSTPVHRFRGSGLPSRHAGLSSGTSIRNVTSCCPTGKLYVPGAESLALEPRCASPVPPTRGAIPNRRVGRRPRADRSRDQLDAGLGHDVFRRTACAAPSASGRSRKRCCAIRWCFSRSRRIPRRWPRRIRGHRGRLPPSQA